MSKRADEAQSKVLKETCTEYVVDVYEARDFVEIHGRAGGDDVCYRVYNDGSICER